MVKENFVQNRTRILCIKDILDDAKITHLQLQFQLLQYDEEIFLHIAWN